MVVSNSLIFFRFFTLCDYTNHKTNYKLAPAYKDEKLEQEINDKGFVHIPSLFSTDEVEYLNKLYHDNHIIVSMTIFFGIAQRIYLKRMGQPFPKR